MRAAFKEWAIVVDALGRGEQIVILRKGGISEGRGGFKMEHPRFFLFPTLFHQQRESVISPAQKRFDQIAPHFPSPDKLHLEFFAEVVLAEQLRSLEDANALRGQHIWRDEVIAERFDWGREKAIFALAVRVFQLPQPIELPMSPSYAGCKSWIELERDIDTTRAKPVLSNTEFEQKLSEFRESLRISVRVPNPEPGTRNPELPLILASSSPRRSELLRELGVEFSVVPSDADEVHNEQLTATEISQLNAYRKARAVAKKHPDALVLGADTLVYLDTQLFGKPRNLEDACRMLKQLQGKTHQVVTGVCLLRLRGHQQKIFAESTQVRFRPLGVKQIRDYINQINPLDKAGAYAIQEHGDKIVESISGSMTNVIGLPTERLKYELQAWQRSAGLWPAAT